MNRTLSRSNSSPSVNYVQRKSSGPTTPKAGASLANFAKLSCSMSYKNRTSMFVEGRDSVVDLRPTEDKYMRMSTASTYCSSRDSNASLNTMVAPRIASEKTVRPSMLQVVPTIAEASDATDTEIKKMQTKRALRRMCLEMDLAEADEDSDVKVAASDDDGDSSDDDLAQKLLKLQKADTLDSDDSDSDDDDHHHMDRTYKTPIYQPSDTVTISKSELRQFQTRLKQLEELCADQAEKQADLEKNIEREVRARTRHLEAQVQEKIEELTMMRELDMDKEIERRFTDFSMASGLTKVSDRKGKSKGKKSFFHRPSTLTPSGSSELEQFREFLMNNSKRMSERLRETASQLSGDLPHHRDLSDLYYEASQNELIEMLEKLRTVAYDQDEQLEQAKYLISVAIAKIEAADEVVNEAFEELGKMDTRLDRASQEVNELRRSTMNLSMLSSSSHGSRQTSIHTTHSFRR
ncbi:hypothetical protein ACHHYP_14920 [Achlya hypogyna]|uniref:Uncharacterized protein n=1 Tax=Achlya hypogyna TaxID=1202772 RepID=A0A1V9YBZ3_ACHHY|nr:hypothetical protein ACHHYP_14920 [Achlya hypogyna]